MSRRPLSEKYTFDFKTPNAEQAEEIRDLLISCEGEFFDEFADIVRRTMKVERPNPRKDILSWYGVVERAYSLEKLSDLGSHPEVPEGFGDEVKEAVFGDTGSA